MYVKFYIYGLQENWGFAFVETSVTDVISTGAWEGFMQT